jgi:hypothetical protein
MVDRVFQKKTPRLGCSANGVPLDAGNAALVTRSIAFAGSLRLRCRNATSRRQALSDEIFSLVWHLSCRESGAEIFRAIDRQGDRRVRAALT